MLNKETIDKRVQELHDKADRISTFVEIYEKVETEMKWNAMDWHEKDEEHENTWFTDPTPESYRYNAFCAYQEALEAIEKLLK